MGSIDLSIKQSVAHITLSSPERRNAMSFSMWQQLREIVARCTVDPEVRVLMLRGAGDIAFVSGADISEFESLRSGTEKVQAYDQAMLGAQKGLLDCPKPVVAAIHGYCIGGGIALALSCDLRYCSDDARFKLPAARLGLGYRPEGMQRVVEVVGAANAAEMLFTAHTFDGKKAEHIGLVHNCYPKADLDDRVTEIVGQIAANAPLTLKAAKMAISAAGANRQAGSMEAARQAASACFASEDYAEGKRAFAEKRAPIFKGI